MKRILSVMEKPTFRQYAVVTIVNLSVLSVGLSVAWPSPVLVKLANQTDPVFDKPITENEGSWIVSLPALFGLFINFFAAVLIQKVGRKFTFLFACVPRIIGGVILSCASQVWMVLLGRVISGFSDGITFTVVPMYTSEIASNEIRGGLGTMLQLFASLGVVTMLCMGPYLDYYTLNIVVLCVAIVTAIPLMFLPDSPYFLYSKGKTEQAIKALTFLRGSEQAANEEIKEYSLQNEETLTISEILKSKTILKSIGIIIVIGVGTQFTGYNGVQFYLQTILESTKTSVSSQIASVIVGCIQLLASVFTMLVIDKFGRKPIICSSLVGMAIGMVGLGTFFKLIEQGYEVVGFLNFLPLASVVVVVYSFSGGLGALIWPLSSELFDGRTRAVGVSIGLCFNIAGMFIVTKFFASWNNSIGTANLYWIFSLNCIALCLFMLFCVPETKGRSFVEIQAALKGHRVNEVVIKEGSSETEKEGSKV